MKKQYNLLQVLSLTALLLAIGLSSYVYAVERLDKKEDRSQQLTDSWFPQVARPGDLKLVLGQLNGMRIVIQRLPAELTGMKSDVVCFTAIKSSLLGDMKLTPYELPAKHSNNSGEALGDMECLKD